MHACMVFAFRYRCMYISLLANFGVCSCAAYGTTANHFTVNGADSNNFLVIFSV